MDLVRIVARRALQLAAGIEVATASQQSDWLEPDQQIRIIPDLLLGNHSRQAMAITTQLHFGLGVPGIPTDRVGWRLGIGAS